MNWFFRIVLISLPNFSYANGVILLIMSGIPCGVVTCKNTEVYRPKNVSFHRFPQNKKVRKKWVISCKRIGVNPSRSRICSQHFKKEDFEDYKYKYRRLKKGAIPTLNLPARDAPFQDGLNVLDKGIHTEDKENKEMTRIASGSEFCCYICDERTPLEKDRINIQSHVPSQGKMSIPERISYLMNDDYYIVITDDDVICKRCSSLINHLERVENERLLVVKALVGYLNSKYKLDISAENSDLLQGKRSSNKERKKESVENDIEEDIKHPDAPNSVPDVPDVPKNDTRGDEVTGTSPTRTKTLSPVMLKRPSRTPNRTSHTTKHRSQDATKMKIYKCGFCSFQSKELNHVRFHMKVHVEGKKEGVDGEKPHKNVDKGPMAVRRRVFRCQVCSQSFTDRDKCLEHISRLHSAFGVAKLQLNDKKLETESIQETNSVVDPVPEPMPDSPALQPKNEDMEIPEETIKDEKSEMEIDEIRMNDNSEPEANQMMENDEETRKETQETVKEEESQREDNVNGMEIDVNMETEETETKLFGCDVCEVSYNNLADFVDHAKLHVMKIEEQRNAMSTVQDDSEIGDKLQHMPEITAERIGDHEGETEIDLESMVAALHYGELNGTEDTSTNG